MTEVETEHVVVGQSPWITVRSAELDEPVDVPSPAWSVVAERLTAMNALRSLADYEALGAVLPSLILDLHSCLDGPARRPALIGLMDCYSAAQAMAKNLGVVDLAQVASRHVRDVAALLAGPEWSGLAAWSRAQAIGWTTREKALAVAVRGADELAGELDAPSVAEVYGSLHLTAALAATTAGRADVAADHVAEAAGIARRPGVGTGFGNLWFGTGNVSIWQTMLAVERGEGGQAVEIARAVDPATLPPSAARRAAWWIDIGRGLAMERRTRMRLFRLSARLRSWPRSARGRTRSCARS